MTVVDSGAKATQDAPGQADQEGVRGAGKWVVLPIVAVGMFMAALNGSVVTIILPSIADYFGVPLNGTVVWVAIAYLVVVAALELNAGRLADIFGRRPIWAAGLAIFTLGSVVCGLAPSLGLLVLARAFQGLGAALMLSIAAAILAAAFPRRELGRAMAWNAVVVGVATSLGPTLGGAIAQHLTWRWVFFINVPLGIISLAATLAFLTEQVERKPAKLDLPGGALLAVGLASLSLGLSFGKEWGWTSPLLLGTLAVGVLALAAAVPVERRVPSPIIDLSLFRSRIFVSANISYLLSFLSLFAVPFLMPFYLVQLRGYSMAQAGFLITPFAVMMALLGSVGGRLADRIGARRASAVGMAVAVVGLGLISFLDASTPLALILLALFVAGSGQALFYPPNNSVFLGSVSRERWGVASGLMATVRAMGMSTGIALAGAIFATLGGSAAGNLLASQGGALAAAQQQGLQDTFLNAFRVAFLVCSALAVLGAITCLVGGEERQVSRLSQKRP